MRLIKNRSKGLYLCFVLLITFVIGGSMMAHADSGPATATIKGGSLTESNAVNHVNLKVSQNILLAKYILPITVIDARGSGAGWNLMITSTSFRITGDSDRFQDLLPANASRINAVNVFCGTNSTCTNPADSISYPVVIPAGRTPPLPVKFFDAALLSGLGKFTLKMIVNVTIPANTEPGTYTSIINLTIANGP